MDITRREMLKLSLFGSAALLLPLERAARTQLSIKDRMPESRLPKPFSTPFAVPPVARPTRRTATTDYYEITMRAATADILPGLRTTIFGYDGITPGPTILANQGRETVVTQINSLPARHPNLGYECTTSVHLHGADSLPQYDGYAEDLTSPGFYKNYRYANDQNGRTSWYHDHAIHHTSENAYMGLAAQYHLRDPLEKSLPIPKGYGRYDVPITIRDAIFAKDGRLIYDDEGESKLYGDVILVNGRPWPVMKVERRKYRFRILNASVGRGYNLALSTGEPLTIIGTDGGLMPAPRNTARMRLGMAERYEVVIDFSKYRIGQKVVLRNLELKNNVEFDSTDRIMRFDVVSDAKSAANNSVPAVLNPGNHPLNPMRLEESQADGTHSFEIVRKNGLWTINGKVWDKDRVDTLCDLNEIDVWEFENKSGGWNHPMHLHLVDFKILDRNGRPPFAYELGPKDTVYVGEGEKVRVIAKFAPHKGKYMVHCHNIVHEDHDMMAQFEVGQGGPDPITAAPPQPLPVKPFV